MQENLFLSLKYKKASVVISTHLLINEWMNEFGL